MASVNKVIIVGNLGRDPEVRTFPNGGQVANVTIATTDRWRDRNSNENREVTEWHNVVFNDRLAEIAAQYLRKGSQVYIEGSLRTRKWQDKSGQDRYTTEIRASVMQMLGGRGDTANASTSNAYASSPAPMRTRDKPSAPPPPLSTTSTSTSLSPSHIDDFEDDDIPF